METNRVVAARELPDAGMEMLSAAAKRGEIDFQVWPGDLPPTPEELRSLVAGAAGIISLVTDRIDGPLMDSVPTLRVVSQFAVGYDNIDVPAASERGIVVCNTPGVLTETTADLAWALLMAIGRRVVEAVDYVRAGKWQTWGPTLLLGRDIHHATLGIVGFGRIGQQIAQRAQGFDMEILVYDTWQDEEAAARYGARFVTLAELLGGSDFVTLHCALTPETHHMISRAQFEQMKPTAMLVNAARGSVVDTEALVDALQSGSIAGAALDVTDPEPIPADHPLLSMPNAIVVPHIASASVATRNKMAEMAAVNLLEVLAGRRPPHPVNPEVLGN